MIPIRQENDNRRAGRSAAAAVGMALLLTLLAGACASPKPKGVAAPPKTPERKQLERQVKDLKSAVAQGEWTAAETAARNALRTARLIDDDAAVARQAYEAAFVLAARNRAEAALRALEEAAWYADAQTQPELVQSISLLRARIALDAGNPEEALAAVAGLDPAHPRVRLLRAEVALTRHHPDAAIEALDAPPGTDANGDAERGAWTPALRARRALILARARMRSGETAAAGTQAANAARRFRALAAYHRMARAWALAGQAAAEQGRAAEAMQAYARAARTFSARAETAVLKEVVAAARALRRQHPEIAVPPRLAEHLAAGGTAPETKQNR